MSDVLERAKLLRELVEARFAAEMRLYYFVTLGNAAGLAVIATLVKDVSTKLGIVVGVSGLLFLAGVYCGAVSAGMKMDQGNLARRWIIQLSCGEIISKDESLAVYDCVHCVRCLLVCGAGGLCFTLGLAALIYRVGF